MFKNINLKLLAVCLIIIGIPCAVLFLLEKAHAEYSCEAMFRGDSVFVKECNDYVGSCKGGKQACIQEYNKSLGIPGEEKYVKALNANMLPIYFAAEAFKKNPTEGPKCQEDIGAIAYAIARLESGVGSSKKAIASNNWWSLHPSKTYWKWDGKSKTHTSKGEVLRHYNTVDEAAFDFMGLWKTSYGCSTSNKALTVYLNGFAKPTGKRLNHVQNYIKNFRKYVKEYNAVFN